MTASKPGLLSRLRAVISGTVNEAIDAVSDPGQELALMLDDLAGRIKTAEKDLRDAMVSRKVMQRSADEAHAEVEAWEKRAEQALRLGDEGLARAALERKAELAARERDAAAAVSEQDQLIVQMKAQITDARAKLQNLNLRRGTLMAQARAAKQGSGLGAMGSGTRIDDIEAKIGQIEALNEVAAEEFGDQMKGAEVDARLAALERGAGMEDELSRLKAKMNQKALEAEKKTQGQATSNERNEG